MLSKTKASTEEEKSYVEREINYFDKNKERMRYDNFRRRGLFVGSGVLEAAVEQLSGRDLNNQVCTVC